MTTNSAARSLLLAILSLLSMTAVASVTTYSDRTTFENLGSISFDYGFGDVDTASGGGLSFESDPWHTNGVTYNTGNNLVIGPSLLGFGLTSNLFTSNSAAPGGLVTGNIDTGFNLFGFDLSTVFGSSLVNITVATNLATYNFTDQAALLAPGSTFVGLSAGAGEYFTSFSIANANSATVPTIDNVTLGQVSPVPEPSTITMLVLGLTLLWFAARHSPNPTTVPSRRNRLSVLVPVA